MPLFLDRLPLHTWTDQTKMPPKPYWSVVLPVIVTAANVAAPGSGEVVTGEAFAWRHHLLVAGLDIFQWGLPLVSLLGFAWYVQVVFQARGAVCERVGA